MNNLIDLARHIPAPDATPTVIYTPISLPMQGCQPLELRLTVESAGVWVQISLPLDSDAFDPPMFWLPQTRRTSTTG